MYVLFKKTERVQLGGRRNLKLGNTVNQHFFSSKNPLPILNFSCLLYFLFHNGFFLSKKYLGINHKIQSFFFNKHFFSEEKIVTCEIYFYYVVKSSTPRKLLYWQEYFFHKKKLHLLCILVDWESIRYFLLLLLAK